MAIMRSLLCVSVHKKLLLYYRDFISVSEGKKIIGKKLAQDICTEFHTFLEYKHPELAFGNIFLNGYLCDDLVCGNRLEVSFMMPLKLESNLWQLIPGEHTVVNNPSFAKIKRTDLDYFLHGNSPWDRYIVDGYLSSNVIISALHKVLVTSVNWSAIGSLLECVIQPSITPGELKLEVKHKETDLDITLSPIMQMGDKIWLALSSENLWKENFYEEEVAQLKQFDSTDSGIRQCCLKLLKFIFDNHHSWNKLTGNHLTHVLLHLSKRESDWSEAMLADRLQQVLEELVVYLQKGFLPCFFDSSINVLDQLGVDESQKIGDALYKALSVPDLMTALNL